MHDAVDSCVSVENRLLSALPTAELEFLRSYLVPMSFKAGTFIAQPGDAMRLCYFPGSGMVSFLSTTENGGAVEVGYTGREGMVGLPAILGKNEMPYQALVQADTECLAADKDAVISLFRQCGAFHDHLLRYFYALHRQIAQTCVCNHFHTIEARLCRWLAVMSERSGNRRLTLTQEFLAHMLGVQRTSIGPIANSLQQAGIIRYSRGRVEIIDNDRLVASACECYFIVRKEYESLYK
ncbi:MAG TPA: Crp/Fnr family transcriptional regulator [Pyrinomonadaceae bacterium]|nr:Crp/Fnr family transcriptional regulator [Pyrinomonadaceae bacterium]